VEENPTNLMKEIEKIGVTKIELEDN